MIKKINLIVLTVLVALALLFSFGKVVQTLGDDEIYAHQNTVQLYTSVKILFESDRDSENILEDQFEDAYDTIIDDDLEDQEESDEMSKVNMYRFTLKLDVLSDDDDFAPTFVEVGLIMINVLLLLSVQVLLFISLIKLALSFVDGELSEGTNKLLKITFLLAIVLTLVLYNPLLPTIVNAGETIVGSGLRWAMIFLAIALIYINIVMKVIDGEYNEINVEDFIKRTVYLVLGFLLVVSLSNSFLNTNYRDKAYQTIDIKDHIALLDVYDVERQDFLIPSGIAESRDDNTASPVGIYLAEYDNDVNSWQNSDQLEVARDYEFRVVLSYITAVVNILFMVVTLILFKNVLFYKERKINLWGKIVFVTAIVLWVNMLFIRFWLPDELDLRRVDLAIPGNMYWILVLTIIVAFIAAVIPASLDKQFSFSGAVSSLKTRSPRQPRPKKEKPAPTPQPKKVDYEALKQLKELLDMGAITQEEFDEKKKDLI